MYFPTLKLCNPYHGLDLSLSVLWRVPPSILIQVTSGTLTLLHFSSIPGYGSTSHTLACNNKWSKTGRPPLLTSLCPRYTKVHTTQKREFSSYLSCFLSQAEDEVDARLRHQHLYRANIVIAHGQRSWFVSPCGLLQAYPSQWDRKEAVEDSGPVIEIW